MSFRRLRIPLKYKFLGVLLSIMTAGFSTFFFLANKTFSEDKKLFVMNMSLTLLKAATSEIKLELKGRLDELQIFIPRVYAPQELRPGELEDPYQGLSRRLSNELLGVTFYKKVNDKYEVLKQYKNTAMYTRRMLPDTIITYLDTKRPLPFHRFSQEEGMLLTNRSIRFVYDKEKREVPVINFLLTGTFMNDESKETIVSVDFLQDSLRTKLMTTELNAELFLVSKKGELLSHSDMGPLVDYAVGRFAHPIVERLQGKQLSRESFELKVNQEDYLCNISETGFNDIMAVSQIPLAQAFSALQILYRQTFLLALLIFSIALIFSILFAASLTKNIGKLQKAAEAIGTGNLEVKLDIHSNDEVQNVAESFQWMTTRLGELIVESTQKARMEEELATARLVQSTLLTPPSVNSGSAEVVPYYFPASECGGDFWDAFLADNKLTVIVGDATGHGAPAAIVTAVAKSCVATLNEVYSGQALSPEQFMTILNQIIYASCKGKLLMTMCMVQIDLNSGDALICNAGHESPMCLRNEKGKDKFSAEVFFSRGERLGFSPDAEYQSISQKLNPGDTVLLYSDGISEAINNEKKEWGERNLKKTFVNGGPRDLETIKSQIVKGMSEHTQGAPQGDDITFVLVGWKGQEEKEEGTIAA